VSIPRDYWVYFHVTRKSCSEFEFWGKFGGSRDFFFQQIWSATGVTLTFLTRHVSAFRAVWMCTMRFFVHFPKSRLWPNVEVFPAKPQIGRMSQTRCSFFSLDLEPSEWAQQGFLANSQIHDSDLTTTFSVIQNLFSWSIRVAISNHVEIFRRAPIWKVCYIFPKYTPLLISSGQWSNPVGARQLRGKALCSVAVRPREVCALCTKHL